LSGRNLDFILQNEPKLEACRKHFLVNRIFDASYVAEICACLESHDQSYTILGFDFEDYRRQPFEFSRFDPGFFQSREFANLDDASQRRAALHTYRLKNNYVMNNNGARNHALREGRKLAKWVLPWDGNCFLTTQVWDEFRCGVVEQRTMKYFVVPMCRVTDNDQLLSGGLPTVAEEEPQIVFRCDTQEEFNEEFSYGRRPKVELLCRLGVEGPWGDWRLDPWDLPPRPAVADGHRVAQVGRVARLFSGQSVAEAVDKSGFLARGRLRENAIISTLHGIDGLSIRRAGIGQDVRILYDSDALKRASAVESWRDAVGRAAEAALARPEFSVIDKTSQPPSGDPHDYWHPAPYWWPDPRRADGLPYVKRDGQRVPGTELFKPGHEAYDRTRLQWLFDDTVHLALGYRFFNDSRYREKAIGLIDIWFCDSATRMNPSLRFAQARMGHDGNAGQSFGIIETRDFYAFLEAVRFLGDCAEIEILKDWLQSFLDWLVDSPQGQAEERARNNHGICYDLQVASIAAAVERTDIILQCYWRTLSRATDHFLPDGSQPHELNRTLSQHYAAFNLQNWLNLFAVYDGCGLRPWESEAAQCIAKASEWLVSQSVAGWRHRQIAPFDSRRLAPIRAVFETRQGSGFSLPPGDFHPDDGIPLYWQLLRRPGTNLSLS